MKVHDCLYGSYELPDFVEPLIFSPEFQRLTDIGLINISSPTFASLSDVSRYSHTLGVMYLVSQLNSLSYTEEEYKALLAALIFHDAGSPAFGHLIEYRLKEKFGFDHEKILIDYLHGVHHPDNTAHQISGQTIRYKKACESVGIDTSIVDKILSGEHRLSKLIFGSLDLDNLDNVLRMSFFLGLKFDKDSIISIARNIHVSDTDVFLPETFRPAVEAWAEMRRAAYEVLVFDEVAVARQAVISKAYDLAMADGVVGLGDWDWSERELLRRLEESPQAKRLVRRYYHRAPPPRAFHVRVEQPLAGVGELPPERVSRAIEEVRTTILPKRAFFSYAFWDRGTFAKTIRFRCPESGIQWSHGVRSASLILDGFLGGGRLPRATVDEASSTLRSLLR